MYFKYLEVKNTYSNLVGFIHLTYTDGWECNEHSFKAIEKVLFISYAQSTNINIFQLS